MPGRGHSTARSGGKATKNPRKYKALRRKGMSKARAAKITNAGKKASRKGGRRSHKGSSYAAASDGAVTVASARQKAAARRNIKKAAKAAKRKKTIKRLPKRTRTALAKQGNKVKRQKGTVGLSPSHRRALAGDSNALALRSRSGGPSARPIGRAEGPWAGHRGVTDGCPWWASEFSARSGCRPGARTSSRPRL